MLKIKFKTDGMGMQDIAPPIEIVSPVGFSAGELLLHEYSNLRRILQVYDVKWVINDQTREFYQLVTLGLPLSKTELC